MTLPPGQRPIDGFPRFGTHLHRPAPAVPTADCVLDFAVAPERVARAEGADDREADPDQHICGDVHPVWDAMEIGDGPGPYASQQMDR
jgi:hypothetical protein